jgi:hypothetical protein
MVRRIAIRVAVVVGLVSAIFVTPAPAQTSPDVTVFAPAVFEAPLRCSWYPNNGQDFYRVVISQFRTFGWSSPRSTRETVLASTYASPGQIGLTPGIWYWRICYGWDTDATHTCYLDDDIRTLQVEQPRAPLPTLAPSTPRLSMANAVAATNQAIRRRYHVRARINCSRVNRSNVLCLADFRYRRRSRVRFVAVEADRSGIYYRFQKT